MELNKASAVISCPDGSLGAPLVPYSTYLKSIRIKGIVSLRLFPGERRGCSYRCTKSLGEGSYAVVYLLEACKHSNPSIERLALKVSNSIHPCFYQAAEREFYFLQLIGNSSGIAPLFNPPIYNRGTRLYAIPMEFYPYNLRRWKDLNRPISNTLQVLSVLSKKFQLLHDKGIVHADVKPENVVIKNEGQESESQSVRIIDFGESFKFGENRFVDLQTAYYRAPEVFLSNHHSDFGSAIDVWSFGCLMYEILTGEIFLKAINTNFCNKAEEIFPSIVSLLGMPPETLLKKWGVEDENSIVYRVAELDASKVIDLMQYTETRSCLEVKEVIYQKLISKLANEQEDLNSVLESFGVIASLIAKTLAWDPDKRCSMADIHRELSNLNNNELETVFMSSH